LNKFATARFLNYAEHVVIAIYFVLCIVLYQERTLFLDNAFQVFLLIQDENIVVNANRWPAVVVRILPLICIKLGFSLKTILMSFSLSYFLFHFGIYAFIKWKLKDNKNAFLVFLLLVIPVCHSFFWCNSELILGLSLMVLWLSFYENQKWISLSILTLILPWVHPLLLLCFLFVITFLFFDKPQKPKGVVSLGLAFLLVRQYKARKFYKKLERIRLRKYKHY